MAGQGGNGTGKVEGRPVPPVARADVARARDRRAGSLQSWRWLVAFLFLPLGLLGLGGCLVSVKQQLHKICTIERVSIWGI
jgi:hypothetical protein